MAFKQYDYDTQQQFLAASQYDDEWTRFTDKDGNITVLRSYYICTSKGSVIEDRPHCNTMALSKEWQKRFEEDWDKETGARRLKGQSI